MLKQTEDLFQKAELYCRNNGIGSAQRYSQHNFRVLSIHVIPPTDSRSHHLLAVSDAGFRFYLEVRHILSKEATGQHNSVGLNC